MFDLIQHSLGYNRDQWTLHIVYNLTGFNIIFTSKYKIATPEVFTRIFCIVERKYGYQVIFICINREKILTKAY